MWKSQTLTYIVETSVECFDVTYSFVQKSRNFRTLRQIYPIHEQAHLVKPILIIAPNGYISDILRPYFADSHNNDASCPLNELNQRLNQWLQEGDIVICDPGYRDSVPALENSHVTCQIPAFIRLNPNYQPRTQIVPD